MASRQCIAASTAANKSEKFNTTAKTWGELKSAPQLKGLIVGDVEVVLNPGSVTLTRDEAELPEGPFKLYIIPVKNKGGITQGEAYSLSQQIAEAIIEGAAKPSVGEVEQLRASLLKEIEDFFSIDLSDEACERAIEQAV